MEVAGNFPNFIVLDRDILEIKELNLTEKVICAYLYAAEECEPSAQSIDFMARHFDISESDVRRAVNRINALGLLEEEED